MEGELLLLMVTVSGRGALSSQANDNWTIGLLLGANIKQRWQTGGGGGGAVCGIGACKDYCPWTRTGLWWEGGTDGRWNGLSDTDTGEGGLQQPFGASLAPTTLELAIHWEK
jgi:hypothetical protein